MPHCAAVDIRVLLSRCHHSKFFVLQYTHGMRVIVHTANLIYCDANNKTQAIWFQVPSYSAEMWKDSHLIALAHLKLE